MVAKINTHLLTDTLLVLVIKRAFSLLSLGRYLLPVTTWNRYQSTGSRGKILFYHYIKRCNYCQMQNVSSNHDSLGFCHDSLNLVSSEKVIQEKLNSLCTTFLQKSSDKSKVYFFQRNIGKKSVFSHGNFSLTVLDSGFFFPRTGVADPGEQRRDHVNLFLVLRA